MKFTIKYQMCVVCHLCECVADSSHFGPGTRNAKRWQITWMPCGCTLEGKKRDIKGIADKMTMTVPCEIALQSSPEADRRRRDG